MQKTREDFVGSAITQNVKYSDNDWQCYGSVDRKSVYSSESILDLILEDYEYDRDNSCYSYYPRANVPGSNCSAATLSHDIILINSLIYRSTNNTSYCSVQNLANYLSYGVLVSNPVYNPLSKKGKINLINLDVWAESNATLGDFISAFLPQSYINGAWVETEEDSKWKAGANYFIGLLAQRYCNSGASLSTETTLRDFVGYLSESGKTKFVDDFSLPLHDPKSVKLPFYPRSGSEEEMTANLVTYFTRLFPNLTLSKVFGNTQSKYYIEYVNDAYENFLSKNSNLLDFTGATVDDKVEDYSVKAASVFNGFNDILSTSKDEMDMDTTRLNTICKSIIENNKALVGGYGGFLPELYLDELEADDTSGLTYQNSFGIHLINPIDKTTVFREDDIKFDVYGSLLIGYNYVDALLSQRTFIGSVLTCLSVGSSSSDDSERKTFDNLTDISGNDPFNKFQKSSYYEFFRRVTGGDDYNKGEYKGYMSVSTLLAIAHLGATGSMPEIGAVNLSKETKFIGNYEPIANWLQNETFLVKAPIYGDFVEPVNFNQDLHPEASVTFKNLRLQKTKNAISPYDDSKTEVPYVSKTNPLINLSSQEKGFGITASRYLPGLGNLGDLDKKVGTASVIASLNADKSENPKDRDIYDNKTSPAFLYDYNKGDEEDSIAEADDKTKSGSNKQRVRSPNGGLTIEGELESPTIDELWTFLKYLTESTGYNGLSAQRALPSFYGIKASSVNVEEGVEAAVVNPKSTEESKAVSEIDILDWSPIVDTSFRSFYDSNESKEFQYAGYEVTKYIPKVEDYKVSLFGRSASKNVFGQTYEYNTEKGVYGEVYDYMVPVLNQTILALDSDVESEWDTETKEFEDKYWLDTGSKKAKDTYSETNPSEQQEKIQTSLHKIFDYDASDTLHNHYKKYMPNPKNLKTIERDLETIRQNLQTFAEYVATTSVLKGSLDRQTNRGTLHMLHRNFNEFGSTFLKDGPTTLRDSTGGGVALSEDVTAIDKKVVYKDGNFETRYKHENFDAYSFDRSGTKTNTRKVKTENLRLIPNETLLSEVYLGADGLYHSVHEYLIAPIVETEY